ELGAHRIVPLLSERVATRLDDDSASDKTAKWQQVAIEAIKQCGAPWMPRVEAPLTPKEFFALREAFDLALVGSLQTTARHPRECWQDFQAQRAKLPHNVAVWIGPEGDFTPEELTSI